MANYKKILVPVDGSTFAAQALPHAVTLAELFQAELVLFQVVPDASSLEQVLDESRNIVHIEERQSRFVDKATRALQALADEYKLHKLKTTTVIESGQPADRIVDYARNNNIDLIIMTTHGRTGLARWVYGSVADKVLRGAPCPVFLVRIEFE